MQALLITLLAYLLGSLPFSYWIVRWVKGIDVRTVGSGNAGATNVLRAAGAGPALLALGLDVLKGTAAVAVARLLDGTPMVIGLAAALVVVGHVFPLFLGFQGGKGVATAFGVFVVLRPEVFLCVLLIFVATVGLTRYVSLASILSVLSFPGALYLGARFGWIPAEGQSWLLPSSGWIAVLVVVKHRQNLRRLWQGSENKLGQSASER